ncbi:TetR/AcrR family transcriptional regulator [Streptosporangium sp. NPDC051022]|uniref:TetR/AcrR family transcriptional regulator n=1 Tax=Streptosporangium sp. NPDC051022 TaxID=3155752 RepID=UPI003419AFA9
MPPKAKTDRGARRSLSRELILDASMRLLAERGLDDLTLRNLGKELGVDPTAIYRYFRDKDELLFGVSEQFLAGAVEGFEVDHGDWSGSIRRLCLRMRDALLTQPRIAPLIASRPPQCSAEYHFTELLLTSIDDAGFAGEEAAYVYHALVEYTIGVATIDAYAVGLEEGDGDQEHRKWRTMYLTLPPREFPRSVAMAPLLYPDVARQFEFGLDLLLDALRARRARDGA